MRILVDEALQDTVAHQLAQAGHDAIVVLEEDRYRIRYLPIDDA